MELGMGVRILMVSDFNGVVTEEHGMCGLGWTR